MMMANRIENDRGRKTEKRGSEFFPVRFEIRMLRIITVFEFIYAFPHFLGPSENSSAFFSATWFLPPIL